MCLPPTPRYRRQALGRRSRAVATTNSPQDTRRSGAIQELGALVEDLVGELGLTLGHPPHRSGGLLGPGLLALALLLAGLLLTLAAGGGLVAAAALVDHGDRRRAM